MRNSRGSRPPTRRRRQRTHLVGGLRAWPHAPSRSSEGPSRLPRDPSRALFGPPRSCEGPSRSSQGPSRLPAGLSRSPQGPSRSPPTSSRPGWIRGPAPEGLGRPPAGRSQVTPGVSRVRNDLSRWRGGHSGRRVPAEVLPEGIRASAERIPGRPRRRNDPWTPLHGEGGGLDLVTATFPPGFRSSMWQWVNPPPFRGALRVYLAQLQCLPD